MRPHASRVLLALRVGGAAQSGGWTGSCRLGCPSVVAHGKCVPDGVVRVGKNKKVEGAFSERIQWAPKMQGPAAISTSTYTVSKFSLGVSGLHRRQIVVWLPRHRWRAQVWNSFAQLASSWIAGQLESICPWSIVRHGHLSSPRHAKYHLFGARRRFGVEWALDQPRGPRGAVFSDV